MTALRPFLPRACFAVALFVTTSAATAEPMPWRIDATAPSACTRPFAAELLGKTKNVRVDPAATSSLVVVVEGDERGYRGSLTVSRDATPPTRRELASSACDDVVRALALVAALEIDPPTPATPPPPAPAAAPEAPIVDARPPPPPEKTESAIVLGATIEPEASTMVDPLDLSLGLGGELVHRSGLLARLRAVATLPASEDGRAGSASLERYVAIPEVCPVALGTTVLLRPCGAFELGVLTAEGQGDRIEGDAQPSFFAAGRLGARLEVRITESFRLGASLGASLPITRKAFVFRVAGEPGSTAETVYRPPSVVGFGSFFASVRFP